MTKIPLGYSAWTLTIALAMAAGSAAADDTATARELKQLERNYCAAQIRRDTAFLADVLDDSYTQVGSRGTLQRKPDVLAGLRDPRSGVTACAQSRVEVRVFDNAAVVTGQTSAAGSHDGVPFHDRRVWWTDTFIRRGGRWRLVATQSTAAAP